MRNGDILVTFQKLYTVFNSRGTIDHCTDSGARVCLVGNRFRCAFRPTFISYHRVHMELRDGDPDPCKALHGDYRRLSG
jgi:hypothetical protein